MYSPKIREDLIPRVYRAAKQAGLHMTAWVNQAVEKSLSEAAANHNRTSTERIVVMKIAETSQPTNRLEEKKTFIIAKGEAGYRVCSPLTPAKQYIVTGIPHDPQCTCEEFMHPDAPPGWVCEHIQAVLKEAPHLEAEVSGATSPAPAGNGSSVEPPSHNGKNGNGKQPRNGKGITMLLKRSVSPDGRIDALSIEFSCPIGSAAPTAGIQGLASVILALQSDIAAHFLKTNGNGGHTTAAGSPHGKNGDKPHGSNGNGNGDVPADAVPGTLLGVASMPTKRGVGQYLSIMVGDKVLKLFGTEKQLSATIAAAGYPPLRDRLADGLMLSLPCRVVTKQSGRFTNIDRVYPPATAAVATARA